MQPQELWDRSASGWIALMQAGEFNRTQVIDPAMLRLAGDVSGLTVCDIGCGEGRFCRMLGERGAHTLGLDPTGSLVEAARAMHPDGRYMEAGAEALPLASESIDLAISYLVLIDVKDYAAAIAEMARVVRRGGRILVANLNSFCTTRDRAWLRDEDGALLHVAVDDYFGERATRVAWAEIDIVNHHRPFENYMREFLRHGLRLTDFVEPAPTAEAVAKSPKNASALRVPYFHIMQWRKD